MAEIVQENTSEQKDTSFGKIALAFGKAALVLIATFAAYFSVKAVIPEKWNLFPKVEGDDFKAGFMKGIGSVGNLISVAAGSAVYLGAAEIVNNKSKKADSANYVAPEKHEKSFDEPEAGTKHRDRVLEAAGARNSPMGEDYIKSHSAER